MLTPKQFDVELARALTAERERTLTEALQRVAAIEGEGPFIEGVNTAAYEIRAMLQRRAA